MPDAYGNLLGIDDFTTGRRVRLVSHLSEDVVIGAEFGIYPSVYVHRLSNGAAAEKTVFEIENRGNGRFALYLRHVPGSIAMKLKWNSTSDGIIISLEGDEIDYGDEELFTIDGLISPWFALNNHDHTRVIDISESDTTQGNKIIGFKWNGGGNQWWRAEVVN